MPTKKELLADKSSAWNTAKPDEQMFILRATDALAPYAVRKYARYARRLGMSMIAYRELYMLAREMEVDERRRLPFDPSETPPEELSEHFKKRTGK